MLRSRVDLHPMRRHLLLVCLHLAALACLALHCAASSVLEGSVLEGNVQDANVQEDHPQEVADRGVEQVAEKLAVQGTLEQADQLEQRIGELLDAVPLLEQVEYRFHAGVVTLAGTVASREAREAAVELIGRLDGVLHVVDEIGIDKSLQRRLASVFEELADRLRGGLARLPLLALAFALFVGFVFLGRWLKRLEAPYRALSDKLLLQNLVRQIVFALVIGVGLFAALHLLDASAVLGTLLGAAGVVGLALSFAFRDIIENFLAGILLALRQPFRARDVVEIDGRIGTVLRLTASETILMTADGNHLRLPNATVFKGSVLNYSTNPQRRFTVSVGVGANEDLVAVQALGIEQLRTVQGVSADPAPTAQVVELGDSDVRLEFYGWVDQREASFVKVSSEAVRRIKDRMDEAGVDLPIPSYSVQLQRAPRTSSEPGAASSPSRAAIDSQRVVDVSPVEDVDHQIERELAESTEPNLIEAQPKSKPRNPGESASKS